MALTDTTADKLFALPPTVAGRNRRLRNRITAVGLVLLLVAGAVLVVSDWVGGNPSCAPGVASIEGECIGVTAGDFPFNPGDARFSAAEDRIWQLNQRVVASGQPYVTVALLTSLTWTDTSAMSRSKVIHQVEGAAVALDRVNNKAVTGHAPLIELLLANEGTNEDHYAAAVGQLAGMTTGDHPLDAVIGLGVSKGATLSGAKRLSDAGVLLVASNLTGDVFDSAHVPGLSRTSTPNSDDVRAIAAHLAARPHQPRTMLVHAAPRNGDNTDYYTSTLAEDFDRQLDRYAVAPAEPFDQAAPSNSFSVIATNLCTHTNPPDMVLYAGREPDLPAFIHDLAQRSCASTPITVVAGTDSCALVSDSDDPRRTSQAKADLASGKITVLCPAWAAPQTWAASPSRDQPAGFPAFASDYVRQFTANKSFGTELDDGYAIMTHDALLTAAKAIRLATAPPVTVPTPAQVLSNQYHMDSANTVPGASGSLTFVEENNGNPAGKPVFVLEIRPSGPPALLYTYLGR
jgi:hypothetical protein